MTYAQEQKLARVERVVRRSRQREIETKPNITGLKLIALIVVSIALVICGAVMGVALEWQPGAQDSIAKAYKAQRHEAATLAVK